MKFQKKWRYMTALFLGISMGTVSHLRSAEINKSDEMNAIDEQEKQITYDTDQANLDFWQAVVNVDKQNLAWRERDQQIKKLQADFKTKNDDFKTRRQIADNQKKMLRNQNR